jgi:N-carbamoyl-L-amino-acid hydrolase
MATPDLSLAERLFRTLRERSADEPGVTRASYGPGEQMAHDLVTVTARELDLEVATDDAGNLYATLPGKDRNLPGFVVGSHLDTVPHGGNYDGAAGVVAGLTVVAGLRRAARVPARDITVMAIRAEESTWFNASYIGSRAALGLLAPEELDKVRRSDTGRTLGEHLAEAGFDPAAVRRRQAHLIPARIRAFVEVHIEQGPVLVERGIPTAVVSGIRGAFRYREARCVGRWAHSGAVPRRSRHDAVMATAALVSQLDEAWGRLEDEGHDLVFTVGQFSTDPRLHAFSKVPGEVRFCIDARSLSSETLDAVRTNIHRVAEAEAARRGVRFEMGPITGTATAVLDPGLRARLADAARALGIPAIEMASGAGHDAVTFANAGVPTAMLFIRNDGGSHNPDETMDLEDFGRAASVLGALVAD